MSLDIRVTYLNFLLTASLGLALWFRSLAADRPLGGFLLALSLVFLFEYGLVGMLDPDTAGRLILATFVFAVFLLILLVNLTITPTMLFTVLTIIAFIVLLWGLFIASGTSTFSLNLCSWTRDGDSLLGGIFGPIVFLLLFLALFFLALLVESSLLMIILFILILGSIFLLATTDFTCFGYYFTILLVLLLFIYYFIPFFEGSFSQTLLRK